MKSKGTEGLSLARDSQRSQKLHQTKLLSQEWKEGEVLLWHEK